jgi:hypothetical protein
MERETITTMANITMRIGIALVFLGIAGYVGSRAASVTALIPAAFGVVLYLLGMMARSEDRRKMAMHIAVVVGMVGLAGSVRGVPALIQLISGQPVQRPLAAISQSTMAVLMAVFVGLCIKSFVDARRKRV